MIFVERPSEPADVLAALSQLIAKRGCSEKKTELQWAREYYGQAPPPTRAYSFSLYKERAVCRALDDLFHDKCAYCESRYRAIDSRDVEHYRPKGGVTESPGHQGYWWLAAIWSNLLPSCPPCNQRRYQTVFDPGMTLEEFERARREEPDRPSGKANAFPLRGNNWVTTEDGDMALEDPLLINPCERNPADHLEFVFDWDRSLYIWEADLVHALVRPKSVADQDDLYAKASIAIYGLNRAGLVIERAARVRELQMLSQPVVDLARDQGEAPSQAELDRIQARLRRYRANLLALTKPDQPYAGMARAYLSEFERELTRFAKSLV
jgi:hypothetical protein